MADVLKIIILLVLTPFLLGFAYWVLALGYALPNWLGLVLLPVPGWIRWILLIPVVIISFLIITVAFNVIFWFGGWYGDSFLGTIWVWGATITQAVLLPYLLINNSFVVAPKARLAVAMITMLLIWIWLLGAAVDTESGVTGFEFGFHGALILSAVTALWRVVEIKKLIPLLEFMEREDRPETDL